MKRTHVLLLLASLALGGCATGEHFGSAGRQALVNEQGHVIGYKEIMRNTDSGEVFAQVNFFRPLRDDRGDVIGYEEDTRGGAIIRDLRGRQIGNRFSDLRSRSTNQRSRGVTLVIGPIDTRRLVAKDRPGPHLIAASFDAADLSALR